jgi:alpha-L-rhamnosidase
MAGLTTLRVSGCPTGTNVSLLHGEMLNADGTVDNAFMENGVSQRGTYICAGAIDDDEVYTTLFSYYGFRYVQVVGYPGVPTEDAVTALFVHSDVPQSGNFASSSVLLNAVQHATRYSVLSNLMDIPTDCPQRERRGWLGDAQVSLDTVLANFDAAAFYTKWVRDLADAQLFSAAVLNASGALPDCVPYYDHGHLESDPGWGIAAWRVPLALATLYDDAEIVELFYPSLRMYMEHWIALAANNTANPGCECDCAAFLRCR